MLLIFTHFLILSEEPFTREKLTQCNKNDIVVLFHCVVLIYLHVTLYVEHPQI